MVRNPDSSFILQILCKRTDQCCASHHSKEACKPAMETLLSQIRPASMLLMNPSATMPLIDMRPNLASKSKSHTLPTASRLDHQFSSVVALEKGQSNEELEQRNKTLAQNFIYPLNGHHRAMSAPRLLQASQANNERDLREKYWGKSKYLNNLYFLWHRYC